MENTEFNLSSWYETALRRAQTCCRHFGKPAEHAEDYAHEAVSRIWEKLVTGQIEVEKSPEAMISKTVFNLFIDEHRRNKKNVPLEMYEARNAVDIAKTRGADKYAAEIYSRAESNLKIAENLLQGKTDKKDIISAARQTVQIAEDARAQAVEKQEQEKIAGESAAASEKAKAEAEAKAATDAAAAKRLANQEAQYQAELAAANQTPWSHA